MTEVHEQRRRGSEDRRARRAKRVAPALPKESAPPVVASNATGAGND
jgi:hypothetical protein